MAVDHGDFAITWAAIRREITRVARATLQNASIGRAGLRIYGGGWLRIVNGGLFVDGEAVINGVLRGLGQLIWVGPWKLEGNGSIEGNVAVTKNLDVTAKTRLRGETTLEDDLEILPGGMIRVGQMTIDSTGSGSVRFANGAMVHAGGGGVRLIHNSSSVTVSSDGISLSRGGIGMGISDSGVYINPISLPAITVPGTPPNLLYVGGGGVLHRTY